MAQEVLTARHGLITITDMDDLTAVQAQNLGEKSPVAQFAVPPEVAARFRRGLKFVLYLPVHESVDVGADANDFYVFNPAVRYANPVGTAGAGLPFERRIKWTFSDGPTEGTEADVIFNADGTIQGPKTVNAGTLDVEYLAGAGEFFLDLVTNASASVKRKQFPIWRGNAAAVNGTFQYAEGAELQYRSDVLALEYMLIQVSAKVGAAVSLTSRLAVIELDYEDFSMEELDAVFRQHKGNAHATRAQLVAEYVAAL